jgi:hypothetical protein
VGTDQAALSYAVGEWARIWPLQQLIRSMGAYFVRRNSRDELYRKVLERYIVMATEAGVTQAVYPEGSLTRDGRMRAPRLGVLDYTVRGFNPEGERDLVFIPLGINYDRTLEDRTLLLGLDENAKKTGTLGAAWNTLAFATHQARLMIKGEWHRFGYACVNFGTPVSMCEFVRERGIDFRKLAKEERYARIAELGDHLMHSVGKLIPVLPVPLVALVFERNAGKALSELEIKAEVETLIAPRSDGVPYLYPAPRPRVRHCGGTAHDAGTAHGRGARRAVCRETCGIEAAGLLREFDCAPAGGVIRRGGERACRGSVNADIRIFHQAGPARESASTGDRRNASIWLNRIQLTQVKSPTPDARRIFNATGRTASPAHSRSRVSSASDDGVKIHEAILLDR